MTVCSLSLRFVPCRFVVRLFPFRSKRIKISECFIVTLNSACLYGILFFSGPVGDGDATPFPCEVDGLYGAGDDIVAA